MNYDDNLRPDGTRRNPKRKPEPELPLFDHIETTKETRSDAYRAARPKTAGRIRQLHEWLRTRGDFGATAWEASQLLDWNYTSLQSPLGELRDEGKIRCNGKKRPTKTGAMAAVFVATEFPPS